MRQVAQALLAAAAVRAPRKAPRGRRPSRPSHALRRAPPRPRAFVAGTTGRAPRRCRRARSGRRCRRRTRAAPTAPHPGREGRVRGRPPACGCPRRGGAPRGTFRGSLRPAARLRSGPSSPADCSSNGSWSRAAARQRSRQRRRRPLQPPDHPQVSRSRRRAARGPVESRPAPHRAVEARRGSQSAVVHARPRPAARPAAPPKTS